MSDPTNNSAANVVALLMAAGQGTRAGRPRAKQWEPLAGRRVVDWSIRAFARHARVDQVVLVVDPAQQDQIAVDPEVMVVPGGPTRAASVRSGLEAIAEVMPANAKVLVHDAARACVSATVIDSVLDALDHSAGAAPALAVTDALWTGEDAKVTGTQDRTGLYRAQTPQGFDFASIIDAHRAHDGDAADDVEVARAAGLDVAIVAGEETNIKITMPEDFARAEAILRGTMDIRVGNGFDVHRFREGDHVILCGIKVPHTNALDGHSDADVAMHAVTDAIYGALADGDIGQHFPPSDPQWKGADSAVFLKHAVGLAADRGYRIGNVDCTIICELPKVGPHSEAMRARMSELMTLEADRISVKATTSERLGFTGRGEGIAAMATATLVPA